MLLRGVEGRRLRVLIGLAHRAAARPARPRDAGAYRGVLGWIAGTRFDPEVCRKSRVLCAMDRALPLPARG
ncbi:hypothetical protein GCM10009593_16700 [Microlunatus antarcticus]